MSYLGKKGYSLYKHNVTPRTLKKIRNELNVKPYSTHLNNAISYPIYRESDTKLYLPRYYGVENYGEFTKNTLSKGDPIHIEFRGALKDFQQRITDKYISHVGESGGGLLDVEPGKGKTVMALNIISRIKRKTLVVVHMTFLMNQWMERIADFLPNAKVGFIQGEVNDIEGKDIVLGMLQSLSTKSYDDKQWDSFGLCIFDECHHLSAESFSNVMVKIVCNYNLGLSGSMTRKDGLSKVFKYFIGPVIHKEKTDLNVPVLVKKIHYDNDTLFDDVKTDFKGNPMYSTMISTLCECVDRSDFLIRIIRNEMEENPSQQMMILAHNKSLIHHLYERITEFEPSVGFYLGGMKQKDLKESESKKIIIATYSMASEGLDIKSLTTLFMATPKTDVCQSVGRILRSEHATPLVIDIVDPHTIFMNQSKKRSMYYNKKKFAIENYSNLSNYFRKEVVQPHKKKECMIKI